MVQQRRAGRDAGACERMKRQGFIRGLIRDAIGVALLFVGLAAGFYIAHGVGL